MTTRLWLYGGPGHPYGSFAGKQQPANTKTYTATFTRLWPYGGSGIPYGSFAGKSQGQVQPPSIGGGAYWPNTEWLKVEGPFKKITEEDELLLLVAQVCAMSITRH